MKFWVFWMGNKLFYFNEQGNHGNWFYGTAMKKNKISPDVADPSSNVRTVSADPGLLSNEELLQKLGNRRFTLEQIIANDKLLKNQSSFVQMGHRVFKNCRKRVRWFVDHAQLKISVSISSFVEFYRICFYLTHLPSLVRWLYDGSDTICVVWRWYPNTMFPTVCRWSICFFHQPVVHFICSRDDTAHVGKEWFLKRDFSGQGLCLQLFLLAWPSGSSINDSRCGMARVKSRNPKQPVRQFRYVMIWQPWLCLLFNFSYPSSIWSLIVQGPKQEKPERLVQNQAASFGWLVWCGL